MPPAVEKPIAEFARAARAFCEWAVAPPLAGDNVAQQALRHVSRLVAAASELSWDATEPADFVPPSEGDVARLRAKAASIPFQYYSEVFNCLVVPPEEPVVGDIVDDLLDIYGDVVLGLQLFESGAVDAAASHWRFWFAAHWGEHATSAVRALWSHLAEREGSPGLVVA